MENIEFQVGDIVQAFGCLGNVTSVEDKRYPIIVSFNDDFPSESFTNDGKYFDWHKIPSLKLIERPKKKTKKLFRQFVTVTGFVPTWIVDSNGKNPDGIPIENFKIFHAWIGEGVELEVEE